METFSDSISVLNKKRIFLRTFIFPYFQYLYHCSNRTKVNFNVEHFANNLNQSSIQILVEITNKSVSVIFIKIRKTSNQCYKSSEFVFNEHSKKPSLGTNCSK